MNRVIKKSFERKQKVTVLMLCAVCTLFCWSCQNRNEADQPLPEPLSDEEISFNLSENGKTDPDLLIGEWDATAFAYTADGKKVSNLATISDCPVRIVNTFLWHEDDELLDHEFSVNFKICSYPYSRSGNKIKYIRERSACFAINVPWTNVEMKVDNSLKNAYSFVIKGNELIIFFTEAKDNNLLIFKKR